MLTGYFLEILRPTKIICCSFFTSVRSNNLLQCSKTGCFRTEYRFSRLLVYAYFEILAQYQTNEHEYHTKTGFFHKCFIIIVKRSESWQEIPHFLNISCIRTIKIFELPKIRFLKKALCRKFQNLLTPE